MEVPKLPVRRLGKATYQDFGAYAQHHPSSDFRQLELYPFVKTEEEQKKQAYRTEQQVSSKLFFSERGDRNRSNRP